jgi:probable F420-dependent oxidoreductase
MQFGVALPQFGPRAQGPDVGERIREVAVAADGLGYHVVWVAEHLIYPKEILTPYPYGESLPFSPTDPILDVATTLAWTAAVTSHVRLGSSVMVLPYHHPIALAKALATVDVLSRGRLVVGVASGWLREEFEMLGVPFHERGARTDEAIDLLDHLWRSESTTFHGRFHTLDEAIFFPKPVQRPRPPIWIGGHGRAALARVAHRGDGWIAAPRGLAALEDGVAAIRSEAERIGRDPGEIGISSSGGATSIEELLDLLPRLERIGVTITSVPALFWTPSVPAAIDTLESFAKRVGLTPRPS